MEKNKRGRPVVDEEKKLYKQEKTVLSNYWTKRLEKAVIVTGESKSKIIRDAIMAKIIKIESGE